MKSTHKKKSSARNKFIIASGGKNKTTPSATLLHINTADKNDSEAIEAHYKELINKGLNPRKIELVVTDMLAAYREVIKKMFPNAFHQFCIFHVLQLVNGLFKDALKEDFRALYALSQTEIQAIAYRDIIIENYQDKIAGTMQKALTFLTENFEYTISYLKVGMLHAKTNNDAERIMRKIERNQVIHYVFRKEESLIRHLKTRLGLIIPIAI